MTMQELENRKQTVLTEIIRNFGNPKKLAELDAELINICEEMEKLEPGCTGNLLSELRKPAENTVDWNALLFGKPADE